MQGPEHLADTNPPRLPREKELLRVLEELYGGFAEAEEALSAIRRGEVDAFLVSTDEGEKVYTLKTAEHPYRILIEQMQEGAALVSTEGTILYGNRSLARLLDSPLERLMGESIHAFIDPADAAGFREMLEANPSGSAGESTLQARDGSRVPVHLSLKLMPMDGIEVFSLVATDLTERKQAEETLQWAYDELEDRVRERTAELERSNTLLQSEIKERKRAEEELQSIARFPAENPNPTLRLDNGRTIIYANKAARAILAEASAGPGTDAPKDVAAIAETVLASGFRQEVEHRIGAETYLLTLVPFTDRHYVNVYGRNITRRKRMEEALRRSEERFRLLTENASDVVIVLDEGGTVSYASPSVRQVGGYEPEELIGRNAVELAHPDDLALVANALRIAAAHPGERVTLEVRLRHRSGDWRNFDIIGINLLKEPAVRGFVANARDITDRRRAEEALRESEEKYRNLIENSIDAVLFTAPDGSVYAANAEACRIFGMTEEELIRAGRNGVVDLSDPRLAPALEERTRTGRFRGELRFRRKDGTVFPGEISSALFADRDGAVRATMIIRDISERKRTEEALARRTEELIRQSREVEAARDEANMYLDIMTHDVRNANNVSGMYADLLTELADGDLKTYAKKLHASIERSTNILHNVATVRRIHEERTDLVPVNLDAVIRNEIESFPGASIRYPGAHVEVLADGLLPTVFNNLISNAVKYGGADVVITIRVEEQNGDVLVSVEDTGPGVSDEVKEKIFRRFDRGMAGGKGEGLGLFIVRTLVDRYGGTIRVEDRVPGRPGEGAAFRFTLKPAA